MKSANTERIKNRLSIVSPKVDRAIAEQGHFCWEAFRGWEQIEHSPAARKAPEQKWAGVGQCGGRRDALPPLPPSHPHPHPTLCHSWRGSTSFSAQGRSC